MSFFSNSNSNRRISRGRDKRTPSLLEVHTRQVGENRLQVRRTVSGVFKLLVVLGLLGAVVFGGRTAVNRLLWENPRFALADIRVSTDGLLTRAYVMELAEVWEGKNFFTLDVKKIRGELDALPQVERAEVRRTLPDRLEIRILERQPVAWVAASAGVELGEGGSSFLVDGRGFVMKSRKILPEHKALPRITGVVMEDVAPGQKLPSAEALSALELIKLSEEDLRWQPRVVDVSKGYCLVVTDDRKARITFRFENIEGQLARLRQLLDYVEPQQRELQSVNLMLERNIPVVFAPPPAVIPVLDPKTGKPKVAPKAGSTAPAPVAGVDTRPASVGAVLSTVSGGVAALPTQDSAGAAAKRAVSSNERPVKKTTVEPEKPLKLAKVTETPPGPPSAVNKGAKRRGDRDENEEEETSVRPPKINRVSTRNEPKPEPKPERKPESKSESKEEARGEKLPSRVERVKPVLPSAPEPAVKEKPGSVPPSEALRKLFNPHG